MRRKLSVLASLVLILSLVTVNVSVYATESEESETVSEGPGEETGAEETEESEESEAEEESEGEGTKTETSQEEDEEAASVPAEKNTDTPEKKAEKQSGELVTDFQKKSNDYQIKGDYVLDKTGKKLLLYTGKASSVSIPSDLGIKTIAAGAFAHSETLKKVVIPEGVQVLEEMAFDCTYGLESITIPASVTSISLWDFMSSTKLKEMKIASGNKKYKSQDGAVLSKTGRQFLLYLPGNKASSYTVPSGVQTIGVYAFAMNGNLNKVTLPAGVKTIGEGAFTGCGNLATVILPDGLQTIADRAFEITNVKKITIPYTVKSIGVYAFESWAYQDAVTISGYSGSYAEEYVSKYMASWDGYSTVKLVFKSIGTMLSDNDVTLTGEPGRIPDGAELSAEEIKSGTEQFYVIDKAISSDGRTDKYVAYDIRLLDGEAVVQPNGMVKVTLPVPEGFDRDKCVVIYVDENGKITEIPVTVMGDYIVFETDHFSIYAIAQALLNKISVNTEEMKTTYKKGEALDLTGGKLALEYSYTSLNKEIAMTNANVQVSGYEPEKTGKQTVSVYYDGKSASFEVTVTDGTAGTKDNDTSVKKTGTNKTTAPKTGDQNQAVIWGLVLVAAFTAIVTIRKRKVIS